MCWGSPVFLADVAVSRVDIIYVDREDGQHIWIMRRPDLLHVAICESMLCSPCS